MWTHYCEAEKTTISVGDGEQCNWCNLFTGSGMASINETEARLNSHEAVCALRYEQINARLKRIENIMLKTAGIMILGMGGTIFSAVWILK
jgi:histone acetyltransferase (RNA polymerase elongator complex component)